MAVILYVNVSNIEPDEVNLRFCAVWQNHNADSQLKSKNR